MGYVIGMLVKKAIKIKYGFTPTNHNMYITMDRIIMLNIFFFGFIIFQKVMLCNE